jgi:hypothetical protein
MVYVMKRETPLQLKLDPATPAEAKCIELLEQTKKQTGMSINTLGNLAIAAGLPRVIASLESLGKPDKKAA